MRLALPSKFQPVFLLMVICSSCNTFVSVTEKSAKDASAITCNLDGTDSAEFYSAKCSSAITVAITDSAGKALKSSPAQNISLTSSASVSFFSDNACLTAVSSTLAFDANEASKKIYFKTNQSGKITLSCQPAQLSLTTKTLTINPSKATAFTISSDVNLIGSALVTNAIPVVSGPAATATNILAPAAPPVSSGPIATTISTVAAGAAGATTSSTLTASSVPALIQAHTTYNATITASATFPDYIATTSKTCEFTSPFASLACSMGSFSFSSALFTTGSLLGSAYISGLKNDSQTDSNSLSVKKFKIKQISNNVPAGTDGVLQYLRRYEYMNGRVYFDAINSAGFAKLFSTDGTDLVQVSNTVVGGGDFDGANTGTDITTLNGVLYFSGKVAGGFRKLFSYDGTTVTQLTDNNPGGDDFPMFLVACNNYLFFRARDNGGFTKLYSLQGTTLRKLSNINAGANDNIALGSRICLNNRLYFNGNLAGGQTKLHSSDGTDFVQVSNVNVGSTDLGGIDLQPGSGLSASWNGRIYFTPYNTGAATRKLHSTDGTTVVQHADTWPGNSDSSGTFVDCGGKLYFYSKDGSGFYKMHSFDGTSLNQVSNTNTTGSDAPNHVCFKGSIYFSGNETGGVNNKLFKIVGTAAVKIADIRPGSTDTVSLNIVGSDYMFMTIKDTNGLSRLFSFDGTTLRQLSNVDPTGDTVSPIQTPIIWTDVVPKFEGRYWFWLSASGIYKLYSTDGTDFVKMFDSNTVGSSDMPTPYRFASFDIPGSLIFNSINSLGTKLYRICLDDKTGC